MKFRKATFRELHEIEAMFINPFIVEKEDYVGFFAIDDNIKVATIVKIQKMKGNFHFGDKQKRHYYKVHFVNHKEKTYDDKDFLFLKKAKTFCKENLSS